MDLEPAALVAVARLPDAEIGADLARELLDGAGEVGTADLLLAFGMRFDDRATGRVSRFAPQARRVQIDIDPAEHNKNVLAAVPIVGDVKLVLPQLTEAVIEEIINPVLPRDMVKGKIVFDNAELDDLIIAQRQQSLKAGE